MNIISQAKCPVLTRAEYSGLPSPTINKPFHHQREHQAAIDSVVFTVTGISPAWRHNAGEMGDFIGPFGDAAGDLHD